MSSNELIAKVTELQELKRMQEELTAAIEAATDEIKASMGTVEEMTVGAFKISWKNVTTSRLDTTALKKNLPDVAAQYTKTSTTRRFTIN